MTATRVAPLLLALRIAAGLAGAAWQLSHRAEITAALQATNPRVTAAQADRVYLVVLVLAVGYGVVYAAGYGLLAVQVRRGRALRVALLVTGLGVLAGVGSLAGSAPFGRPIGALVLLLDAAAFTLLARRNR